MILLRVVFKKKKKKKDTFSSEDILKRIFSLRTEVGVERYADL